MTIFADTLGQACARVASWSRSVGARLGLSERRTRFSGAVEAAARIGYAAQGLVYGSAGVLTLLAAFDLMHRAAGSQEATFWLSRQPFGRLWLLLLALGLLAFVQWCLLQAIFDADREGSSRRALMQRAGHASNGLVHLVLALTCFGLLLRSGGSSAAEQEAAAHRLASSVLALPYGDAVLLVCGATIVVVGLVNAVNAARTEFTATLSCSEQMCRRIAPLARVGNMARALSFAPLGLFLLLGGLHSRASEVRTFGTALDGLGDQPGGAAVLAVLAFGLMAFGAFSFVEALFRRIRPPRDLSLT